MSFTSRIPKTFPVTTVSSIEAVPSDQDGVKVTFVKPLAGERRSSHTLLLVGTVESEGEVPSELLVYLDCFLIHRSSIQAVPSEEEEGKMVYRFRAGISTLGLPKEVALKIQVNFPRGAAVSVSTLHLSRRNKILKVGNKLQPCLVTGLGRSGTTRMMKLIAEHPEISANTEYPLETRIAQYLMQQYYVTSSPAVHEPTYNIDNFFNRNSDSMCGPCPYYQNPYSEGSFTQRWVEANLIPAAEKNLVNSVEDYYRTVGGKSFFEQKRAKYFLEKAHPYLMPFLFDELYPAGKEIFLVRDFRDMFASMVGFNEKRKSQDFGRATSSSDMEFLKRLCHSVQQITQSWKFRGTQAHLVKYEELCRDEARVMAGVFDFLGLPALKNAAKNSGKAEDPATAFTAHRTSGTVEDSIGKWARVLPPELAEACNRAFSEALKVFGYETDLV